MKRSKFFQKIFTSLLTLILFGTNVLFAYTPEINFWKERRQKNENNFSSDQPHLPKSSSFSIPKIKNQKWIEKDENDKLKDVLSSLSSQYGSIQDVVIPKNKISDRIVVHVQDIHMNHEAQKNIGSAIQKLINENQIDLIALEGAFNSIDLSDIRELPHEQIVKDVANHFLSKNKISGPIHMGLTTAKEIPPVLGIDDWVHYQANVNALKRSYPLKEKNKKILKKLKLGIQIKKEKVFDSDLHKFDRGVQSYRQGKITLVDYAHHLVSHVDLNRYKELERNFRHMALSDGIDVNKLNSQLKKLEDSIFDDLAKTMQEKALVKKSRGAYLLGKLFDFALMSNEWNEYLSFRQQENIDGFEYGAIKKFEDFYIEAKIRDEKISENLLARIEEKDSKVIVLVTGGFHSKGIQENLVSQNMTVVSWVPKLTEVGLENTVDYLDIFMNAKMPFGKSFKHKEAALATHPFSAVVRQEMISAVLSKVLQHVPLKIKVLLSSPQVKLSLVVAFAYVLTDGITLSSRYILHYQAFNILIFWFLSNLSSYLISIGVRYVKTEKRSAEKIKRKWNEALLVNMPDEDLLAYRNLKTEIKKLLWTYLVVRIVLFAYLNYLAISADLPIYIFFVINTMREVLNITIGSILVSFFTDEKPIAAKKYIVAILVVIPIFSFIFIETAEGANSISLSKFLWIFGVLPAVIKIVFNISAAIIRKVIVKNGAVYNEDNKNLTASILRSFVLAYGWIVPILSILFLGALGYYGIPTPFFFEKGSRAAIAIFENGFSEWTPLFDPLILLSFVFIALARYAYITILNKTQDKHKYSNQALVATIVPVISWILAYSFLGEKIEPWYILSGLIVLSVLLYLYDFGRKTDRENKPVGALASLKDRFNGDVNKIGQHETRWIYFPYFILAFIFSQEFIYILSGSHHLDASIVLALMMLAIYVFLRHRDEGVLNDQGEVMRNSFYPPFQATNIAMLTSFALPIISFYLFRSFPLYVSIPLFTMSLWLSPYLHGWVNKRKFDFQLDSHHVKKSFGKTFDWTKLFSAWKSKLRGYKIEKRGEFAIRIPVAWLGLAGVRGAPINIDVIKIPIYMMTKKIDEDWARNEGDQPGAKRDNIIGLSVEEIFQAVDSLKTYAPLGKFVDSLKMNLSDSVMIVGNGPMPYLPMALALRSKRVDVVQPLTAYGHGQTRYLRKWIARYSQRLKERWGIHSIEDRIDTHSYEGLIQDVELPKQEYSLVFLPSVFEVLKGKITQTKFLDRVFESAQDEFTIFMTLTIPGGAGFWHEDHYRVLEEHADLRGYDVERGENQPIMMNVIPENTAVFHLRKRDSSSPPVQDSLDNIVVMQTDRLGESPADEKNIFNALDFGNNRSVIQTFGNPDERKKIKNLSREEWSWGPDDQTGYDGFHRELGEWAGLEGNTMYYPLGGFDVYSPFRTNPQATDVIATGLDAFGGPDDIETYLTHEHWDINWGDTLSPYFDAQRGYAHSLRYFTGLKGLGPLAIARIMAYMKGQIKGVYYFDINEDGDVDLFSEQQAVPKKGARDHVDDRGYWREEFYPDGVNPDRAGKNAMIEFIDSDGKLKRYWYIQNDIREKNPRFEAFLSKVRFQTLYIRAPFNLWDNKTVNRGRAIDATVVPAIRNKARFIMDQRLDEHGVDGLPFPHPIIRKDASIKKKFLSDEKHRYGNSLGKNGIVYAGTADDLADNTVPKDEIFGFPEMIDAWDHRSPYMFSLMLPFISSFKPEALLDDAGTLPSLEIIISAVILLGFILIVRPIQNNPNNQNRRWRLENKLKQAGLTLKNA